MPGPPSAPNHLEKARRYCAMQERCHQELRDKLYDWGLHREEVEQIIGQMIVDGYLNEQRFAEHFAVSKFRQKGWGRVKIRETLKHKKLSTACIAMGLIAIDEEEYMISLTSQVVKQLAKLNGIDWVKKQVVKRRLLGRGFEGELIEAAMKAD